ncbi:MAG TPA: shikimate dehydrogenase [Acidimicrobiales bacterium]|nr:shikimate dehydrogenase [Acidimicrobiales bacterium]
MWRLGVVGYPVEHSLSPVLHLEGLRLAGLTGTSERVPLDEDDSDRLATLLGARFDALSVTMPLKAAAAACCHELDDAAARTGMVNSLLWREGRILGANTDGAGLVEALAHMGVPVKGARCVVLGAGGAARAIVDALVNSGAEHVAVLGRTRARVDWFLERYDRVGAAEPDGGVDLVVNTTPSHTRVDEPPLAGATSATLAVDIAYEPRMSSWRALYETQGCRSANGLGMLAFQAARQMRWWWGVRVDGARLLEVIS